MIEDGAKPDVIRDRVTHTKAARDAFSGYDRGPHWIEACGEVAKLRLTRRLATSFATAGQLLELSDENGGGGGSRTRVRRWVRTSFYACRHAVWGLALAGGGRSASATSQQSLGLRVLAGREAQSDCVGVLRLQTEAADTVVT